MSGPPGLGTAQERFGEREVHPVEQFGVVGGVRAVIAVLIGECAGHPVVEAPDACRLRIGQRGVAEGDRDDPADGPGEPPERVGAIAGPVMHAGHGARMERLHQQCPDPGDEGRHPAVHGPRGGAGPKYPASEPVPIARTQSGDPSDCPVNITSSRDRNGSMPRPMH